MKDISNEMLTNYVSLSKDDLVDRTRAFDMFRKAYRKNEAMEENRTLLKEKYAMGKTLGMGVNETRNLIKAFTNKVKSFNNPLE